MTAYAPWETPRPAPVPAAPLQSGFVEFERLEFGKFTLERNGPIEPNAEHRILAHTAGFPAELIDDCDPSTIGVGGNLADLPPGWSHGTVLRPVIAGDRTVPVMARLRQRPEQGEGATTGRSYTVARYLVGQASETITPLAYFDAMQREPLGGFLRSEQDDVAPLRAAVRQVPDRHDVHQPFVDVALTHVMSGIPINIVTPIPEEVFFTWATALSFLVPESMRPLLSFGWSVTEALVGQLTMTACPAGGAGAASYDPRTGTWTPPVMITLEGRREQAFAEQRLAPGRMYLHRAKTADDGTLLKALDEISGRFRLLPDVALPRLPVMRHPALVRILRWPGLRLIDDYRLQQFTAWLEAGNPDAHAEQFLGSFNFPESEHHALLAALTHGIGFRPSAADAYFAALGRSELPPMLAVELRRVVRNGAARARLLISLAAGEEPRRVLPQIVDAALANELQNLSTDTTAAIARALDETGFDLSATTAYATMLLAATTPPFITDWMRAHAMPLALALARWQPPSTREAISRLAMMVSDERISAIAAYVRGETPPASTAALRDGEIQAREAFARQAAADWEMVGSAAAERRERILEWGRYLRPEPRRHSLLRFAYGENTEADVDNIATEIEAARLPASLSVQAAAYALQHWKALGPRIRRQKPPWTHLTSQWPRVAQLVLLDEIFGPGETVPHAVQQAFDRLEISADETEELLRRWIPRLDETDLDARDVARFLWRLACQAEAGLRATTCVNICRNLDAGNFDAAATPAEDQVRAVERLCIAAEENTSAEHGTLLFQNAVEMWQIRIAFELYPGVALVPTLNQLHTLARNRPWLNDHLARPNVVESRRAACRLATATFHQYAYGATTLPWRGEYATSFLWGAFSGVPLSQQGSLYDTLQHFTHTAQERIAAAGEYHRNLQPDDEGDGVERIIRDVLIPLFDQGVGRSDGRFLLTVIHERNHPPARFTGRVRLFLRRVWHAITFKPRVQVSRRSTSRAIVRVGRTIRIAEWVGTFLRNIDADPAQIARAFGDAGGAA